MNKDIPELGPEMDIENLLANGFGLADGDETFPLSCRTRRIALSSKNEGSQGWSVGRHTKS